MLLALRDQLVRKERLAHRESAFRAPSGPGERRAHRGPAFKAYPGKQARPELTDPGETKAFRVNKVWMASKACPARPGPLWA